MIFSENSPKNVPKNVKPRFSQSLDLCNKDLKNNKLQPIQD